MEELGIPVPLMNALHGRPRSTTIQLLAWLLGRSYHDASRRHSQLKTIEGLDSGILRFKTVQGSKELFGNLITHHMAQGVLID